MQGEAEPLSALYRLAVWPQKYTIISTQSLPVGGRQEEGLYTAWGWGLMKLESHFRLCLENRACVCVRALTRMRVHVAVCECVSGGGGDWVSGKGQVTQGQVKILCLFLFTKHQRALT